jgi:gamma-glutamylaminecyclotransferase
MKLFVYGTLKSGQYFHNEYMSKAELICNAQAGSDYALYIDAIPSMIKEHNTDMPVKGELYKVDEEILKKLDDLEGHPNVYHREPIDVYTEDGKKIMAWAYLRPNHFKGKHFAIKTDEFI